MGPGVESYRTFVHIIGALCNDGNEIRIYVLIQNWSVVQDAPLRMHVFVRIFRCDLRDFLRIVESTQIVLPYFDGIQLLKPK